MNYRKSYNNFEKRIKWDIGNSKIKTQFNKVEFQDKSKILRSTLHSKNLSEMYLPLSNSSKNVHSKAFKKIHCNDFGRNILEHYAANSGIRRKLRAQSNLKL